MNWASRNNLRNQGQEISGTSCWMYCERTEASSDLRSRTVCSEVVPLFSELEIHSFDRTSRNGTQKSAYLLLYVNRRQHPACLVYEVIFCFHFGLVSVPASSLMSSACIVYRKLLKLVLT